MKDTKRVDSNWKIYYKEGHATMLLFEHLTHYNAEIRVNALTAMYSDWIGRFIIAH